MDSEIINIRLNTKTILNLHKPRNIVTWSVVVFIMGMYPLIYQLFENNGAIAVLNKLLLFSFVALFVVHNRKLVGQFISSDVNFAFFLSFAYILFSLLLYSEYMRLSSSLKEASYILLPYLFYFAATSLNTANQKYYIQVVIRTLLFVVFAGLITLFGVHFLEVWTRATSLSAGGNFHSYYTPITMGFCSQFLYACVLYRFHFIHWIERHRLLFLLIFLGVAVITLQRAAYMGILSSTGIYLGMKLFDKSGGKWSVVRRKTLLTVLVLFGVLIVVLLFVSTSAGNELIKSIFGFDLRKHVFDEFRGFNLTAVNRDRVDQAVIYNKNNIFNILFGEGVGSYSPNNDAVIHKITDANYHRIFNEMGVIGSIVFFAPFILLFLKSFKEQKTFAVYFTFQTIAAFYFNRILWNVPISYFIYPMFAFCQNKELYQTETLQKRWEAN